MINFMKLLSMSCTIYSNVVVVGTFISPNFTWLVTSRLDTTRSTCQAHAFWLCGACRTARLVMLDTTISTGSTRSTRRPRQALLAT